MVFLCGMEDGLFPHQRSLNDAEGLEEERRLCYVGTTRAMKQLFITYAEQRRLHGMDNYGTPSRFISEIPEDLIEEVRPRIQISRPVAAGRFKRADGRAGAGRQARRARAAQEVWRRRDPEGGRPRAAGEYPGEFRLARRQDHDAGVSRGGSGELSRKSWLRPGRRRTRWCAWGSIRSRRSFRTQFRDAPGGIFQFNKAIIDATRDLVCAYKPQFAHYAAHAAENQLEHTIDYIKSTCPNAIVILDSKRGDIGSTAEQYAQEAFERYGADAVTVNPYLGRDSVEPFLKHDDKGVIILCRTSNPGAKDFQDLTWAGQEAVPARRRDGGEGLEHAPATACWWSAPPIPEELADIRRRVGDLPFLVPGVGAQGGDVAKVMAAGKTAAGHGARDQLVTRDPLRELGRELRRGGAQGGEGIAGFDQRAAVVREEAVPEGFPELRAADALFVC